MPAVISADVCAEVGFRPASSIGVATRVAVCAPANTAPEAGEYLPRQERVL